MFGSKRVVFILDVSSGIDSGCSVPISGLGSVLPGLISGEKMVALAKYNLTINFF